MDEYGDVQGLVTLEDLLEELVGEFTSDTSSLHKDVHREKGGTFIVNASASVRTLNRKMGWSLPTSGPRTLNGLIELRQPEPFANLPSMSPGKDGEEECLVDQECDGAIRQDPQAAREPV